jgi:sugar phosphate isomerase/epimerase
MKLGVSMWSYVAAWKRGEMDIPGFIREADTIGAEGVELLDYFWKDRAAELPAVERALTETSLPVGVYSVANNFALPDPADRAAQIQIVKDGVDNAVHFGAKVVRVFAGNPQPDIGLSDAFAWIVSSFQSVVGYAQENGVTLALENHGALAGRSDQVALILDAVGSPALGANPDTGNFLLVHDTPHDAVARLAPRAAMVHFKDFKLMPDEYSGPAFTAVDGLKFAGTAIGEGDVALADCLASLRAAGFDGWINVEYEAGENPLTGVSRSLANARQLLEALSA